MAVLAMLASEVVGSAVLVSAIRVSAMPLSTIIVLAVIASAMIASVTRDSGMMDSAILSSAFIYLGVKISADVEVQENKTHEEGKSAGGNEAGMNSVVGKRTGCSDSHQQKRAHLQLEEQ